MPDAPHSPRKVVSSVSQQARSQKKPGAPKPKGAVRAKSGCYTCRIRRKKCDEQPNDEGACQTCVRLRLQCLGFGAKRPDWMRESNSVAEMREKIKAFLASNGMIKGHSQSGPRTEDTPAVLVLADPLHPSPSSPPTPTLSATSSDGQRPSHNGMNTSFERVPHYASMAPPDQQQQSYPQSWQSGLPVPELTHGALGPHDPTLGRIDILSRPFDPTHHQQQQSQDPSTLPTPIVSAPPWPVDDTSPYYAATSNSVAPMSTALTTGSYAPSAVPQPYYDHPRSSLAPSYNLDPGSFSDDEPEHIASPDGPRLPMAPHAYGVIIPTDQNNLINHYLYNVLPRQYLLADPSIRDFMSNLIHASPSAFDAACLLSALHMHCMRYPTQADSALVSSIFRRVQDTLLTGGTERSYNEGDAMAGLHIVSSFLFSGGRGSWEVWLNVASQYVQNMLNDTRYTGPDQVLQAASESTRFIIKTTMWFDVLASVTTQQIPRFLETYRLLFKPTAFIGDTPWTSPATSMLPVMGCENKIVLAIAEISNLAYWKESHLKRGCLSIPELVHRGGAIEESLLQPSTPPSLPIPLSQGLYGPQALNSHSHARDAVTQRRRLANDIFRASAKVYLHTVLSGDYPACPEIMNAVSETIAALQAVPDLPSVHRSVVRSVVFGICISGCLTDDPRQRSFLLHLLEKQQQESVGNVSEVMRLMKQVWARRDAERERGHCTPVDWREVMRESHPDLLLLV